MPRLTPKPNTNPNRKKMYIHDMMSTYREINKKNMKFLKWLAKRGW